MGNKDAETREDLQRTLTQDCAEGARQQSFTWTLSINQAIFSVSYHIIRRLGQSGATESTYHLSHDNLITFAFHNALNRVGELTD